MEWQAGGGNFTEIKEEEGKHKSAADTTSNSCEYSRLRMCSKTKPLQTRWGLDMAQTETTGEKWFSLVFLEVRDQSESRMVLKLLSLTWKQHFYTGRLLVHQARQIHTRHLGPRRSKPQEPGGEDGWGIAQWRVPLQLFWSNGQLLHSTWGVKNQTSCQYKIHLQKEKTSNFPDWKLAGRKGNVKHGGEPA